MSVSGGSGVRGGEASTGKNKRVILWFRNDLRLHDNPIVYEAMRQVQLGTASEVLPVYCFDSRWFHATSWNSGYLKTGPYRAQFLLESVLDLKSQLRNIGSDLLITMGPPEKILPTLLMPIAGSTQSSSNSADTGRSAVVLAQSEVTSEETSAETAVRRALKASKLGAGGAKLELHWGSTLFHVEDLPFQHEDLRDMPDVFTPFKQKCENQSEVRKCLPGPTKGSLPLPSTDHFDHSAFTFQPSKIEDLNAIVPQISGTTPSPQLTTPKDDPRTALAFKGGESAALERLKYYLWDSNLISNYFNIRNGMLGGDYSTKLAPALAHGCISPRFIYSEIKRYEAAREANKSTYWVIFELIWRDYFKFFALKHGDRIFHLDGTSGKRGGGNWSTSPELLARWKEGKTGWPLVDANMRELAATGWMSNRGRQNVASFLALDLGIDWRVGADWFECLLLDYDPASNWGNWVAAAGVNGGRVNKFNITKQSKDYDPEGDYIRHWCPELSNVPASRIFEPWLMSKKEQELYGVRIGVDYPQAIPSSAFAGRSNGGGGRGDGGGVPSRFSNGSGNRGPSGGRGGGRGGSSSRISNGEGRREFKRRSEFDMYG